MAPTYRYWFMQPVMGEHEFVDRPFPPLPQYNQPGGEKGIEANIGGSTSPVFVPWSNIAYVERLS
jgi:hypothetical protein